MTAGNIDLVWARESLPASGPSVFLAGPTSRLGDDVRSWRPAAVGELVAAWPGTVPLAVFTPESRGGVRARHYEDQVEWETKARAAASVIMFWIPRDVRLLPGFTTNVEFGLDVGAGRPVVLGCPPDCPSPERNRYLIWVARQHGVPIFETLHSACVHAAVLAAEQLMAERAPVARRDI